MDLDFNRPLTMSLRQFGKFWKAPGKAWRIRCRGRLVERLIELEITSTSCASPPFSSLPPSHPPGATRGVGRATRKLADIGRQCETFGGEFLPINDRKFVTRRGTSRSLRRSGYPRLVRQRSCLAKDRATIFFLVSNEVRSTHGTITPITKK